MKRSSSVAAILSSVLALLSLFNSASAEASTITVTSAGDSGPGTLRQAILSAAGGDTINFSLPLGTAAITLTSDELVITKNLAINGPGANLLTVQRSNAGGTPDFRIFHIAAGNINATISGLTISNGSSLRGNGDLSPTDVNGDGGGIVSESTGTSVITGCLISGNACSFEGGGVCNLSGTLTITSCMISSNSTALSGGGIANYSQGTVNLTNSTLSGNNATLSGGGFYNAPLLTVNITNSTISGNTAGLGGGLYNSSGNTTANISSSTISNNSANGDGGVSQLGQANVRNCIIARNTDTQGAPDFNGALTSQGYNLIGNTSHTNIAGDTTGNQLNVNPLLGPLQDNGGPTFTQALLVNSPAIDKGSSGGYIVDQRGFTRPVDDPSIPNASGGDGSDIGAFENQNVSENKIVTNNT